MKDAGHQKIQEIQNESLGKLEKGQKSRLERRAKGGITEENLKY